jgi:hypothetical protein
VELSIATLAVPTIARRTQVLEQPSLASSSSLASSRFVELAGHGLELFVSQFDLRFKQMKLRDDDAGFVNLAFL